MQSNAHHKANYIQAKSYSLSSYSHLLSPRGVNRYVYNTHFIFHLIYVPFSLGKNHIARHCSISVFLLYLKFYSFDKYRESPSYLVLLFGSSIHLWRFLIITIPPSFLVPSESRQFLLRPKHWEFPSTGCLKVLTSYSFPLVSAGSNSPGSPPRSGSKLSSSSCASTEGS